MKIETIRAELRRLFTRLIPQAQEKGYALYCQEFISVEGKRGLEITAAFKDAKGSWHCPVGVFFWEHIPSCWEKDMATLKSDLKKEGFKL